MPRTKTTQPKDVLAAAPHIRLTNPRRYLWALAEVRRLLTETEDQHQSLLGYARTILSEAESDPFFLYIIRRLWLERHGELGAAWQDDLPSAYKRIREQVVLPNDEAPPWISSGLLAKTLCLYQPYYSMPLTPKSAIGIIINASRLIDAGGIK